MSQVSHVISVSSVTRFQKICVISVSSVTCNQCFRCKVSQDFKNSESRNTCSKLKKCWKTTKQIYISNSDKIFLPKFQIKTFYITLIGRNILSHLICNSIDKTEQVSFRYNRSYKSLRSLVEVVKLVEVIKVSDLLPTHHSYWGDGCCWGH